MKIILLSTYLLLAAASYSMIQKDGFAGSYLELKQALLAGNSVRAVFSYNRCEPSIGDA
jgi:hypothetical protein